MITLSGLVEELQGIKKDYVKEESDDFFVDETMPTDNPPEKGLIQEISESKKLNVLTIEQAYMDYESKYRVMKDIMAAMDALALRLVDEKGIGYTWQDPTTKAVFQVVDNFENANSAYTSARFSRYAVAHTARKQFGETSGTLSKKDAQALGYQL